MHEKTLLEVDARIAKLRDRMAAGAADINDGPEIDRLIERRMELLQARAAALREQRPPNQNITARG